MIILQIVVALLIVWAILYVGKVVIYHFFYDPIGKARRIMESRLEELEREESTQKESRISSS